MADIFISYSRKDAVHAEALAERLRHLGISVWLDTAVLAAAETWSAEIVSAIKSCKAMVVLLSPDSVASHNVTKEVGLASEKRKTIIPIELVHCELNDAMEYALAGIQRVKLSDETALRRSIEKLGLALRDGTLAGQPVRLSDPAAGKIRLAVLPFDDLSPSHDNEWFADGIMDELINTLSSLESLHVAPRSDVAYYKKHKLNPAELVDDLQIAYLVEGSVQKAGEKIRIRVSLTDARAHRLIWSEKYDGTFDDIFELQDKTCFAIAEGLKLKLTPEEERKIGKKETESAEAYELFLKGLEHHRRHTRADFIRALELHEAAVRLDPRFAKAHISIAKTSMQYYRTYLHEQKWIDKARHHIAEAEAILGESAPIYRIKSVLARTVGDREGALRLAERAVELEPEEGLGLETLAFAYRDAGRMTEASEIRRNMVERKPKDPNTHFNYLISLRELNDSERLKEAASNAIPVLERHLRLTPDDLHARAHYANLFRYTGDRERALAEAYKLEAIDELDGHALFNLACLYIHFGEHARGLAAMRKSIARGFHSIEAFLEDPDLAPVHSTPEFEALIKELQAKLASEKRGTDA